MTTKKLRHCTGSTRFGIEAHEAPVSEFTKQPSRKDGLAVMCAPHWKAYVKGLAADRKTKAGGQATVEPGARPAKPVEELAKVTTKRERRRTPMAIKPEPKPESPRVRKARETLAEVESLPGPEYVKAVGSDEVQAALEVVNGHGTSEPDDGQVLVAGVLYDAVTLVEVETPIGETIDASSEEADAA